ncbi:MAG: hypothetical protein M1828_000855 [Chrysothrix sp. TS-e1954]|nr:MAG: hypothetical protein M1828_000855 [Chrysothrix sp. TS-e1954]
MQGLAPVFGKIFDSYGPRYLLIFGTTFHVFGLMMTSLSSEYYQTFLSQSVCSGLGASALFYAGTNAVATWFDKRRALALGIVASGSSVSGLVVPILGRILPGWAGDRFGRFNIEILIMIITGIFVLALWIPAHSSGVIVAFSALYGFSSGAFASLLPALVAQISE